MTAHRLVIAPGAARVLPPGERPWRVRKGEVEVYLISPERRRLIAVAAEGEDIFPTADGLLTLSLLATGAAELEQRPAEARPLSVRAVDPLTDFEPTDERDALRAARERRREQARDHDHGLER